MQDIIRWVKLDDMICTAEQYSIKHTLRTIIKILHLNCFVILVKILERNDKLIKCHRYFPYGKHWLATGHIKEYCTS